MSYVRTDARRGEEGIGLEDGEGEIKGSATFLQKRISDKSGRLRAACGEAVWLWWQGLGTVIFEVMVGGETHHL